MFQRLLVAIDGSPSSPVTLSFATALAHRHGASVHVLYVNQSPVRGQACTELTETGAGRMVEGAVRQLRESAVDVTGSLARTSCFQVAQVVVDVARARRSDAIVMGSRRRRHIGRLLGHGTRERVTSLSPLPVLIAPAPLSLPRRRGWHAVDELSLLGERATPATA